MMPETGGPPEYWLVKTTHQNAVLIDGARGFFYVFYKGDAVQVCTIETSMTPAVSKHLAFTEKFALAIKGSTILPYKTEYTGDEYDGYLVQYATDGLRPGFIEASGAEPPSWTAQFNCAGNSTPPLPYNHANSGRRIDISNKALISVATPSGWTSNYDVGWTIGYGYYPQSFYTYNGYGSFAAHSVVRYDISFYDYSDAFLGTATIVIPFYDAEAAYLQSEVHVTRTTSGHETQREENYNFVLAYQPKFANGSLGSIYLSYEAQDRTTSVVLVPFAAVGSATTESELSSNQLLAHRAGITPAIFGGDVARYFDNSDYVQTTFKTLSSVSASTPVVLGRISSVGASGISIGNLALVGWI